jgi:hypothetical protein
MTDKPRLEQAMSLRDTAERWRKPAARDQTAPEADACVGLAVAIEKTDIPPAGH